MTRAKKVMVVLIVASLGIWGCAQSQAPSSSAGLNERIKILELKNAKLEEDFRSAATTRDQVRKKLTTLEEEKQQLQQEKQAVEQAKAAVEQAKSAVEQARAAAEDAKTVAEQHLKTVTTECDELKQLLTVRTSERDAMVTQFELFRKSIRELLGQTEASLPKMSDQPVTTAGEVVPPGNL